MDSNLRDYASREELLAHITKLEEQLEEQKVLLEVASSGLESWSRRVKKIEEDVSALCLEHVDNEGTLFFDAIVELFDVELTRTVTYQYSVSIEVQATVPASMDMDEVMYDLTIAKLDYEHLGNGDVIIEDFSFGDMEVE